MIWLNRLFRRGETHSLPVRAETANGLVSFDGAALDLSEAAHVRENIAHPDFERARAWVAAFPNELMADAVTSWLEDSTRRAAITANSQTTIDVDQLIAAGLLPTDFARRPNAAGQLANGVSPFGLQYRAIARRENPPGSTTSQVRALVFEAQGAQAVGGGTTFVQSADAFSRIGVSATADQVRAVKRDIASKIASEYKKTTGVISANQMTAISPTSTFTKDLSSFFSDASFSAFSTGAAQTTAAVLVAFQELATVDLCRVNANATGCSSASTGTGSGGTIGAGSECYVNRTGNTCQSGYNVAWQYELCANWDATNSTAPTSAIVPTALGNISISRTKSESVYPSGTMSALTYGSAASYCSLDVLPNASTYYSLQCPDVPDRAAGWPNTQAAGWICPNAGPRNHTHGKCLYPAGSNVIVSHFSYSPAVYEYGEQLEPHPSTGYQYTALTEGLTRTATAIKLDPTLRWQVSNDGAGGAWSGYKFLDTLLYDLAPDSRTPD